MRLFLILTVAGQFAYTACAGSPEIDREWAARLKQELGPTVNRYLARPGLPREIVDMTYQYDSKGKQGSLDKTITIVNSRLGTNWCTEKTIITNNKPENRVYIASCGNEDYNFAVQKNEGKEFTLVNFSQKSNRGDYASSLSTYAFDVLPRIADALNSIDGYILKEVRWVPSRKLLFVKYTEVKRRSGRSTLAEHRVHIDPADSWKIIDREIITSDARITCNVQYGSSVNNLPYPSVVTESHTPAPSQNAPSYRITLSLSHGDSDKRPGDFRLSAFGLPEPPSGAGASGIPRYMYFLIGSVLFALIAFVMRRYARRRTG